MKSTCPLISSFVPQPWLPDKSKGLHIICRKLLSENIEVTLHPKNISSICGIKYSTAACMSIPIGYLFSSKREL